MKTGRGIIHSEMPAMSDGKLLFSALDKYAKIKMNKPEYHYIKNNEVGLTKINADEKIVKVIAGKFKNIEGPEKNHNIEPIYFHIILNKDKEFKINLPLMDIILLFISQR